MYETSTKGQVIYIRHGTTDFNKALAAEPQNKEILKLDESFLDCPLSEEGRKDAESVKETVENINIKYVFVSPLLRCLETAEIVLNGHKDAGEIEVFIHPYIAEIVSACHDISINIKQKKERFNNKPGNQLNFNWKYFDEQFPDLASQENCFASLIDNPSKERVTCYIEQLKTKPEAGLISNILGHFWKENARPESISSLFNRCLQFKNFLKEFRSQHVLNENEKIMVITHSAVIRISSSKLAYEMKSIENYPCDCYSPKNCELLSINLEN